MGRSYDDFEAWLEAVDYYLDGQDHTDFESDHEEAWASDLSPSEWADLLPNLNTADCLHDDSECWP